MMRKPHALKPGSRVALIAPAFPFKTASLRRGVRFLESWGMQVSYDKRILNRDYLFAGTDEQRTRILKQALYDPDIEAIWCLRGGYGSPRLMPDVLRWKRPKDTKFFIGFSDITALHIHLIQNWKWICFHGPMATRLGSEHSTQLEIENLRQTAFSPDYRLRLKNKLRSYGKTGSVQGPLVGGNLTMLDKSLATDWEIDTRGKILFIEEVGERSYSVDRMLVHLDQAGKFDHVKAVVFGDFTDCVEPDGKTRWKQVLTRFFKGAGFPVLQGIPAGHGHQTQLTLPLGAQVAVEAHHGKGSLEVLEQVVMP